MGALAIVRERLSGLFELYVAAPLSNVQLLLGKYLAYSLFTLIIAAAVVAGLLGPLGVPLLGSPWRLALVIVTLTLASVGLGFVLSLLASSERQAVQFAMLALLAVVFFSGFAMPLEALHSVALLFSYAVPATYGVGLLREVMLGGTHSGALDLAVLAAIAVGLSGLSLALLIWRTRPD